jgi:hypothetical protein
MVKSKLKMRVKIYLIIIILILFGCHRRATCPAYSHVDPSHKNINQSFENFVNTKMNMTEKQRKQYIEFRKTKELRMKHHKKNSTNLFPSHMR